MSVSVLGATGSIGTSTLDLIARHPGRFEVHTLSAHASADKLAAAAKRHRAKRAIVTDPSAYDALKAALAGSGIEAAAGIGPLEEAASEPVDCLMASIVGAAGLRSAFAALGNARRLALANKECLVCAGDIFMKRVSETRTELLPVDSEHSAAFQALGASEPDAIEKITLTASGGPFRSWSAKQIASATRAQALNHPNWSMGAKITIDSASMMNKGLELIEAYHLFPVTPDQLDCVVHPQSIVHCLVSYRDGSVLAQLSEPDMRTPIALALSWPARIDAPTRRLDLASLGSLTFEAPDELRFPALRLAKSALRKGGAAPTVLNAANEVAVERFLSSDMPFPTITQCVENVLSEADKRGLCAAAGNLEDVLEVDRESRQLAAEALIQTMSA